ncbi:hypothetical protein NEISICOT_02049 [Neisseria sicca ATCC 29256]|uniref:Uncharacterized protein n=1 Tax=Neisseria sicca ATCC 29256 TaxID=547045 RepID=C6M699_NEISI|nr:hypothetical protein [Neisseria sicca]EET44097.1 hypothetical protein NEISICOT_02049 [Neisseria sicca ATCC 29256]
MFHDVSFNRGRLKTLKTGFQTTFAFGGMAGSPESVFQTQFR